MKSELPTPEQFVNDRLCILAFDPGETTGYCILQPRIVSPMASALRLGANGTFGFEEASRSIGVLLDLTHGELGVCVVESFRLYPHRAKSKIGSAFPEIRVIGMIEHELTRLNIYHKLVWQGAYSKSNLIVDPGHVGVKRSPHILDAYRHARYFWVMHYKHAYAEEKKEEGKPTGNAGPGYSPTN